MIKAILGAVAGLILGTIGSLAYSQYVSDQKLADLQAQLNAANDKLAKETKEKQSLTSETSSVSDQIDQLQATNDDLKKQLDAVKSAAPAVTPAAAPALNPMALMGMLGGMMRGGGMTRGPARMVLLQSRLHLTPDQAAQIKAAMDADNKARRELMQQAFRNGGKIDPQAAAMADSLDTTLNHVLSPEQQVAYKQVQADEQASRADTMATVQVDQMMPLLQLTDAQKDQVYNSIYQAQLTAPDPMTAMTNPNAMASITRQAQVMQDAMTKVLTPDQVALYQQAAAAMPQFGGPGGRRGQNGGGQQANGGQAPATPVVTTAAAATPNSTSSTTTTTFTDPNATNAASSTAPSTNAPADASTTNAAPATTAAQ